MIKIQAWDKKGINGGDYQKFRFAANWSLLCQFLIDYRCLFLEFPLDVDLLKLLLHILLLLPSSPHFDQLNLSFQGQGQRVISLVMDNEFRSNLSQFGMKCH